MSADRTSSRIDLAPAADEVARLVTGVPEGLLTGPTPCPDYPVAALLDHLMGLSLAFTWAAEKSTPPDAPTPGTSTADALDPRWREELPVRLATLVRAWRNPAAWAGTAEAGGVTMPAEALGVVALDELVVHGWDLARATGQDFRVDPAHAAAVLEFTRSFEQSPDAAGAIFGPAVAVPGDAPVIDRALGFAGRDPRWTP
jgi:uncharacterized protein (TIGR03086 family)